MTGIVTVKKAKRGNAAAENVPVLKTVKCTREHGASKGIAPSIAPRPAALKAFLSYKSEWNREIIASGLLAWRLF